MRKITTGKTEITIYDNDGRPSRINGWYATDGVNTYTGKTEIEAVSHYGVPVGNWSK